MNLLTHCNNFYFNSIIHCFRLFSVLLCFIRINKIYRLKGRIVIFQWLHILFIELFISNKLFTSSIFITKFFDVQSLSSFLLGFLLYQKKGLFLHHNSISKLQKQTFIAYISIKLCRVSKNKIQVLKFKSLWCCTISQMLRSFTFVVYFFTAALTEVLLAILAELSIWFLFRGIFTLLANKSNCMVFMRFGTGMTNQSLALLTPQKSLGFSLTILTLWHIIICSGLNIYYWN